jgi:hypothetical protein
MWTRTTNPPSLRVGRAPRWGALLYVINNGFDEELGEVTVDVDATSFRRGLGGWQESSSSGGGGWWTTDRPLLRRPELPSRTWQLHHSTPGRTTAGTHRGPMP